MVKLRHWMFLLAILPVTVAGSGCAALIVGGAVAGGAAAGYAYYNGNVPRDFPAGMEQTWTATHLALNDLGYPVVRTETTSTGGFIESKTAEGQRIVITLQKSPQHEIPGVVATRVGVRVAVFGDQPLSEHILHQIQTRLGPVTVSQPPVPTKTPTLNRQIPIPQNPPAPAPIPVTTKGQTQPKWTAAGNSQGTTVIPPPANHSNGIIPVTVRDAQPQTTTPRPRTTVIGSSIRQRGEPPLYGSDR